MRVLVPLLHAGGGNEPFFYLMSRLDMDFTVLTYDPLVEEQCAEKKLVCVLLESPPLRIPGWIDKIKHTRLGKHLYEFLEEYRLRRRADDQAKMAIEKINPEAMLLPGDFQGLLYSLCQYEHINSVVVQITLDWMNIDTQLNDFRERRGKKGELSKKILRVLSKLTRRRMLATVHGEDFLMYGSDIGRTLGAVLAGVRFGIPLKGGTARYVCVNGEQYRESFIEAGIPPEKVIVTGSPDHDRLFTMQQTLSGSHRITLRNQLGIPDGFYIVTLFAQPFTPSIIPGINYPEELLWIADNVVRLFKKIYMVVKLHPGQSVSEFPLLDKHKRVRVVESEIVEEFNNRLIFTSRLVILRTSTVGYNALALDVPLLTYGFNDLPSERYFEDVGGSLHAHNKDEFMDGVHALLFDEDKRVEIIHKQQRARERHMMLDGKCCERIGDVLRRK